MATRTKQQLIDDVTSIIVDNSTNLITPEKLRQRLLDLIDSMYTTPRTVGPMTIGTTEWTDVAHNAGHPARMVNFKDAAGLNVPLQWRLKAGAEATTIEAKSNTSLPNITIHFICFT